MIKILTIALYGFYLIGCVSVYPVVENLEVDQLPVEVNFDCFITHEASFLSKAYSSRCPGEFGSVLFAGLKSGKMFSSISEGESKFLSKNQITLRVDYKSTATARYGGYGYPERTSTFKWKAWNLDGLLVQKSRTFTYIDSGVAETRVLSKWNEHVGKEASLEIRRVLDKAR